MNNKLYKIVKIIVAVLGLIGVLLLVRVMMVDTPEEISDKADLFVSFTLIMLGLTVAITVIASVFAIFKTPGALKQAGIALVVMGGLFALAYVLANDAEVTNTYGQALKDGVGEAGVIPKRVGAMIKYTYILGAIALATIVWGGLKGMFSK